MEIKKEDIIHLAKLSMLNLSEEEIEKYKENMKDIVEFANTINELDTEGIEESAFATTTSNVFRKDEVRKSFEREELLKNAPTSNGEAYSLPSMME